ncbi:MAG: SUMF1/EgtB/PvdO family nonheme iron enzyme, partial [Proteobacteria bacterium]|nr:SUMF1/EgtB/PvdO family nonheme iron enzyme [Pseudomonadota bacterium]
MRLNFIPFVIVSTFIVGACTPEQRCYRNEDCPDPMICTSIGECDYKCKFDVDCGSGFVCKEHQCVISDTPVVPPKPEDPVMVKVFTCPEQMVAIHETYCMDIYEASRPDATETSEGKDSSMAVSKKGVMPWMIGDNNAKAEAACEAAGKRLCSPAEWEYACRGVNNTEYGYGESYDPAICNGLDTFGSFMFHPTATGAFPDCTNGWGIYDLNGNYWEHTSGGSGKTVRGGAYNCLDSLTNHKCSYIPGNWTPTALGFRCCADGEYIEVPASSEEDDEPHARLLPDIFSDDEIVLAWNETDSDTMTDAGTFTKVCTPASEAIDKAVEIWDDPELARDAVEILKESRECNDFDPRLERALGVAYAKSGNYPWALKTLRRLFSLSSSTDCESLAWIAWIQIQMGMPDDAEQTLSEHVECDNWGKARLSLLSAFNEMTKNEPDKARDALKTAYEADAMSKSDKSALSSMQSMLGVAPNPNFTWKVELDGGYASNALSGSPNDPTLMEKKLDSPFLDGDIRVTLDLWKDAFVRSVLEGQFTGQYLTSKDASDFSYIDLSLRLGVAVDTDPVKIGVWYRPESLFMTGGDKYNQGPLMFYTSHRLELDFEILKWLYLFAGYGHRTFRQEVRTRDEFDLGAGGRHGLYKGLSLTWGLSYRQWFSSGDMYNLNGMNVSLALDYRIPKYDVLFRLNGSFSYDGYPDSEGYFEQGDWRSDKAARGAFQVWSPEWAGVRVGAQFKASRRWSTAKDYEYTDYRGMIAI